MENKKKFRDAITPSMLSRYTGLLSLSSLPICITDEDGGLLYEMTPIPGFCKYICDKCRISEGSESGRLCDCMCSLIKEAADMGTSGSSAVCPYGLTVYVNPVTFNGETAAFVAGGFAYGEDSDYMRFMLDLVSLTEGTEYDVASAAKFCSMMKTVNRNDHEAHRQLCRYIASSVSRNLSNGQTEVKQSVEQELMERKILDLESKHSSTFVNTNFLFNTLNCIARTAYFESAEKTESLIYYLSDLLRFNSDERTVIHSIQSEIEHIEKYLAIQKVRYNNRLQYSIDLPEGLGECRIINLVIAPLVDNALEHGILLKRDGGTIKIRVESRDEVLVISVMDNGNGFSEDVLTELREKAFLDDEESSLCMVNKRLKLFYGEGFGIDVVKSDFSGSTVEISIPKIN